MLDKESHSDFLSLIWNPLYVIISQATKTQLKWGQLKKNKTETSKKSSRVFLITLKGGGSGNVAWENFDYPMLLSL